MVTLSAVPWRTRRAPQAGAAVSPAEAPATEPDQAGASAREQRRFARADRAGTAAAANDRFLDVVVIVSVVVFVVLVMGFGMLVLQNALQS
jgi:hypothetical protein